MTTYAFHGSSNIEIELSWWTLFTRWVFEIQANWSAPLKSMKNLEHYVQTRVIANNHDCSFGRGAISMTERCATLNSMETVLNVQLKNVVIMVAQRTINVCCAAWVLQFHIDQATSPTKRQQMYLKGCWRTVWKTCRPLQIATQRSKRWANWTNPRSW
jgi:hypothetical protein